MCTLFLQSNLQSQARHKYILITKKQKEQRTKTKQKVRKCVSQLFGRTGKVTGSCTKLLTASLRRELTRTHAARVSQGVHDNNDCTEKVYRCLLTEESIILLTIQRKFPCRCVNRGVQDTTDRKEKVYIHVC